MSLTTKDLHNIESLIKQVVLENIGSQLEVIKQDIVLLKDGQAQIRKELDTEHEVRRQHIEDNTRRISALEKAVFE